MLKFFIVIFLLTGLWPAAEAQAGNIFGLFRQKKEPIAYKLVEDTKVEAAKEKITKEETLALPQLYKAKKRDSLSTIATRFYGDVSKWFLIYEANKDKIKDPNRITPGIELTIPAPQEKNQQASPTESLYQQAKEDFTQGDYLASIVKFDQVIELEKGLYPAYTPYAQEYIQMAREIINEPEDKQIQAQRQTKEERLRNETEKKDKLAQIEAAYKETQVVYSEAEVKFEKELGELGQDKRRVEEKQVLAQGQQALAPKSEVIKKEQPSLDYTIGTEDVLYIFVWQEEDLSEEVIVRPDGKISFPLAGDVPAAGLTFAQLKEELTKRLKDFVKYPVISVSLRKLGGKKIIVLGEVGRGGVYSVTGKCTVLEAIGMAGGFTPDAVLSSTMLIRGGLQNPKGMRLNLTRAIGKVDMSQNVVLQAEDVIYVPKKFIANVNYAITQIIGPISQGAYTAKTFSDW